MRQACADVTKQHEAEVLKVGAILHPILTNVDWNEEFAKCV